MVAEFSALNEGAELADFTRFVRVNLDNSRGITDESVFVSSPHAVEKLYTIHKAKGLEFDRVYIIDAVEDNWRPRLAGRKPPANLPLEPPGEQDDDYIRLLYVAATRARHSLIISSYKQGRRAKMFWRRLSSGTPYQKQPTPSGQSWRLRKYSRRACLGLSLNRPTKKPA